LVTTQAAGGSQQIQEHDEVNVEDDEPPISGAHVCLTRKQRRPTCIHARDSTYPLPSVEPVHLLPPQLQIVLRLEIFTLAAGFTYSLALADQTFGEKSRRAQHHPRMMPIRDEDDTQPHPAEAGTEPSDLFAEEIKYFQSKTLWPQNTDPDLSLTWNLEEDVPDETNDVPVIIIIIDLSDLVKPRIIALVIVLVCLCELVIGILQFDLDLDLISSERDSEMLQMKFILLFSFFVLQHVWEELSCAGIVAGRLQGPRKLSTPRTTAAT
jgi:hypothetical protein